MTFKDADNVKNVLDAHQKNPFAIDEKKVKFCCLLFVFNNNGSSYCSENNMFRDVKKGFSV